MSDQRTAVGFFFEGPPPAAPEEFDGVLVLESRSFSHGTVGVLVLLHYVFPLGDRLDTLGQSLDARATSLGAKFAIVDPLYNLNVGRSWATAEWPDSWQVDGDLFDSLLRDVPWWKVAWIRRDIWDEATDLARAAVLRDATASDGDHGVILHLR